MEEAARGVRNLAKVEALAIALIPYVPAGCETCETPGVVPLYAACETLAGIDALVGIGGTAATVE